MSIDEDFKQASEDVQKLSKKPDNKTLLQLYSLYKQATEGDVTGDKPGAFDMVKRKKYEAWQKLQGIQKEQAQKAYIELVNRLKN
ncbi:MAG: acyl-CoA-binding protein [Bdellovibrionales bacterium]|nr:acyl-CoA-binding protein [Bdellovibrionales bacterium]